MALSNKILYFYRYESGVLPVVGSISWEGNPTITDNGVVPGHGPILNTPVPSADGMALIVRARMTVASADLVGDVQLFGPIYVCSDGVKVKIGDSTSLYATDWIVGDVLDFTGHFLDSLQRAGILGEFSDDEQPVDPPVYQPATRTIKLASLPYGVTYVPSYYDKTKIKKWIADTFDFVVNGGADLTFQSRAGYIYATYGAAGTYIDSIPDIRSFCDSRGWLMDDILSHMSVDFIPAETLWKERDKFFAEKAGAAVTTALYDSTTPTTMNEAIYIGQYDPFDEINVTLVGAGVNGAANFQYWDGSMWKALSVTDNTNDFAQDGKITFTPPNDWRRTSTTGVQVDGFWIRITPVAYDTAPVINRMYSDNWLTFDGTTTRCRGWDATSPSIINSGELLYNPTPPAGSSAKFRHQGRTTGYWTANQMRLESSRYIGDVCPAGEYFLHRFDLNIKSNPNVNGLMWDTAYAPSSIWVKSPVDAESYMDVDYSKYQTHLEVSSARYKYVIDKLKIIHPDVAVYGNLYSAPAEFTAQGDGNLLEYYNFYSRDIGGTRRCITIDDAPGGADGKFRVYDGMLPENNPTGVKSVFMYDATALDWYSTTGFWDKANREPILCLAKHLIGQNENVYFSYHGSTKYNYSYSHEILVWKFETELTAELTPNVAGATKHIYGLDFSGLDPLNSRVHSNLKTAKRIRLGDGEEIITVTKDASSTDITTTSEIRDTYPAGSRVRMMGVVSFTDPDGPPLCEDVYRWPSFYFPAMDADIGVPDINGHNGGAYDLMWKTPAEIGGAAKTEVWRRDYTKAIVLLRVGDYGLSTHYTEFQTPCAPIALGGTYYPLKADGTIGEGVTSIGLRACEAAILMKSRT